MRHIAAVILTITMAGCASVSPEAEGVMVHRQMSSLLDDCTKLGNVTSEIGAPPLGQSHSDAAEYELRQTAYDEYKADTVVVMNTNNTTWGLRMQGIAFKCD